MSRTHKKWEKWEDDIAVSDIPFKTKCRKLKPRTEAAIRQRIYNAVAPTPAAAFEPIQQNTWRITLDDETRISVVASSALRAATVLRDDLQEVIESISKV